MLKQKSVTVMLDVPCCTSLDCDCGGTIIDVPISAFIGADGEIVIKTPGVITRKRYYHYSDEESDTVQIRDDASFEEQNRRYDQVRLARLGRRLERARLRQALTNP